MTDIVVDTSVIVKWYIPEQHHTQARSLRDDYLDGQFELVAPALLPFEAINALKYSGHYDGDRLGDAATSLAEYGIDLVPFHKTGPVAAVASNLDITVYDAAYITLAQKLETNVFTADDQLLESLTGDYAEIADHIKTFSS